MVAAAGIRVVLGQQDAVALDLVDGADMLAVRPDDLHMLVDLAAGRAGPGGRCATSELVLEPRAVLLAIFVIVAVERRDLARRQL